MKKHLLVLLVYLLLLPAMYAQRDFYNTYQFSRADSLRGQLSPLRSCYDVYYYELDIKVDPSSYSLEGAVNMEYEVVEDFTRMQIDLFSNMKIHRIEQDGRKLNFSREFNSVFIDLPKQPKGSRKAIMVTYSGSPIRAANAPWDGGFVWRTDRNGNPWIAVACEGTGASLWWPNKDHLSDEPDSMTIAVSVPDPLQCISNGNLRSVGKSPGYKGYSRYEWFVSYPINNYNVTVNIGDYAHFSDTYESADGSELPLDYYVLSYNLDRAKKHFQQVHQMLNCFEQYFGKYPFWDDGYALVETPYLGMEHQSAIAYGNRYMKGYLGGMIPPDMDWDYIIIHETGHEYFGNAISIGDLSEMWIHESFTTYMEALYVECRYGYEDALRYLEGQLPFIQDRQPILGPRDVNWENWSSSDHYFKGSWVLHTLRNVLHDDNLWFEILREFYQTHKFTVVTTTDFTEFVNQKTGSNYDWFFEQYLWYPNPPTLIYQLVELDGNLIVRYKWEADVAAFQMPVQLGTLSAQERVVPENGTFKELIIKNARSEDFYVATNRFYIRTQRLP